MFKNVFFYLFFKLKFFNYRAQGLKASITSGSRLRTQSEHVAFILIDRASNDGLGSVVGLLKGKYVHYTFFQISEAKCFLA